MSYNKRVYTRPLEQAGGMNPSPARGDLTGQAGNPGPDPVTGVDEPVPGIEQPDSGQPQYRGGYSMIAPNASKRSQLQLMANKELEDLRQWKETHKPGSLSLTPMRLGGLASEQKVRRQQQINLMGSKLQQRAKKEEQDRKKKEAEELEYQKMKDIQREKANKLEEKRKQEEMQRKAQQQGQYQQTMQHFFRGIEANRSYQPPSSVVSTTSWAKKEEHDRKKKEAEELEYQKMKDIQRDRANILEERRKQEDMQRKAQQQVQQQQTMQHFLDRIDANRSRPSPSSALSTTSWDRNRTSWEDQKEAVKQKLQETKEEGMIKSEYLAEKESQLEAEQQRRLQDDHRRKNNAFLDNLERRQQSGENLHHISPSLPDEKFFRHQVKKDTREYVTAYHGDDEEEYLNDALTDHDVYRGSPEGADQDWDLMKLSSFFPDYEVKILEELLEQCNGDYARVIQLLQ
ncbi:epithelial-stromal interaction protein 1 isoform X2 [Leucoraja erinacea]|uniref:epithelial-stromal interaction protein 1 isoform X1 n=1 Tax=Leucoraja erinaceus TaxID=7782 RepID=UPI0024549E43|nr:epithelial-stromal interaction protein 1 isoform X1 [Leucoraja erinacea]XP_055500764.1 epithelial-stromal interaction protein 1 isoform X2 [Leucoraja erinacea]